MWEHSSGHTHAFSRWAAGCWSQRGVGESMPTPLVIRSASSGADAQEPEGRELSPRERSDIPQVGSQCIGLSVFRGQSRVMQRFTDVRPVRLIDSGAADPLRLAVAAYLARYTGASRDHAHSDLRCFLSWCAERGLDPLAAGRGHLELYIRWMQEVRRFKPSTVSRRFSVTAGFYRIAVIDGVLDHSPAEQVRRPAVPPESPTLGFTHLQFEAMLTAARESPHRCDFALVAMLGLLGLRIFEATGADIADLGEEHGHQVLRVRGKGAKVVLVPCRLRSDGRSTAWWTADPPGRSC